MKPLLALFLIFTAVACEQKYTTAKTAELKKNFELQSRNSGFPWGNSIYYCFENFDAEKIADTFRNIHRQIFPDNFPFEKLDANIYAWLRDSIFISLADSMNGQVLIDSVNLEKIKDPLDHYLYSKPAPLTSLYGKLLSLWGSHHTATIDGKKIYYNIIPYNGRLVNHVGKFLVETHGYYAKRMKISKEASAMRQEVTCKRYIIDWYFTITSDHFFDDQLAFSITDTCSFYSGYFFPKEPGGSLH